jgi:hypothetical protein
LLLLWLGLIGCRSESKPSEESYLQETFQTNNSQQIGALATVEATTVPETEMPKTRRAIPTPQVISNGIGAESVAQMSPAEKQQSAGPVIDPSGDISPRVNPELAAVLHSVSTDNLMSTVQSLEGFGTRNSFSETESETRGIGAARRWIFSEFERLGNGRLQVSFDDFSLDFHGKSTQQRNIVATLQGRNQGAGVIIVMAHYDSRNGSATNGTAPAGGANDNGSGVALLLESARLLSSQEWNQTIVFLALAAEEQGAYGARHYVHNIVAQNMNVLAAINYDGVGGRSGISQSVRLFAPDMYSSPAGELARYYATIGGLYFPEFPVMLMNAMDREGRWGDQREFTHAGLPAVRISESEEKRNLLNSARDTWSLIDYNYLRKVTQLNIALVANAAGAPEPPLAPLVTMTADRGGYQLSWSPAPDESGYAVSFRPVDSPTHTEFRLVKVEVEQSGNRGQAGDVVLNGLDADKTYAISLAAVTESGLLGYFSGEVLAGPESGSDKNIMSN